MSSKPVSNAEIEDVLTSIRRLVSEDARIGAVSGASARKAVEITQPEVEEKSNLVLTPSLRVAGQSQGAELAQSASFVAPKPPVQARADANFVAPRPAKEPVAKPVKKPAPRPAATRPPRQREAEGEEVEKASLMDPEELRKRIAALENVVAGQTPKTKPPVEQNALTQATPRGDARPAAPEASTQPEATAQTASAEADAPAPPVAQAAPETVAQPAPEVPAPSASEARAPAAPEVAERQTDEISNLLGPDGRSPDTENAREAAVADALLDEELLRAIVREMVEEQLQGAMGERVTRNLRRLVRREIQRALALQEFEP